MKGCTLAVTILKKFSVVACTGLMMVVAYAQTSMSPAHGLHESQIQRSVMITAPKMTAADHVYYVQSKQQNRLQILPVVAQSQQSTQPASSAPSKNPSAYKQSGPFV